MSQQGTFKKREIHDVGPDSTSTTPTSRGILAFSATTFALSLPTSSWNAWSWTLTTWTAVDNYPDG
jgi:hypothetical protein